MLVHGPSSIWTQASSIPIETCAFVSTGGKTNGCEKGVGVGVIVGVAVAVGVAVVVGVGVGVDDGVVVGVAVAVGVGVGVAVVYWIVSTGGLALSRVSNRFAVAMPDSSPNTNQPKLVPELSSHDCTSAVSCGELQVYTPIAPTDWLALTVGEKSPPSVVQKMVLKKRWRHVASLVVAGAPIPSSPDAWDVPSPQSASSLCNSTVLALVEGVLDMFRVSVTPVIVEPAGTFPPTSNASTPRRISLMPVSPVKKWSPRALLRSPSAGTYW